MKLKNVSEATYIAWLIRGHCKGELSENEELEFQQWLNSDEKHQELLEELTNPEQQANAIATIGSFRLKQQTLDMIYALDQQDKADTVAQVKPFLKKIIKHSFFKYAAVVTAVLLGFGGYFYQQHKTSLQNRVSHIADVAPGGNSAVLTLADGRKIQLNESKEVVNTTAGKLSYSDGTEVVTVASVASGTLKGLNAISTPKGGQYQIILPDGTKVWLNAASILKYPDQFNGKYRQIELVGEAYFEVSHHPEKPFIVRSNRQTVKVLGTHFNIKAYADETSIRTTLIKGAVQVSDSRSRDSKLLKPGQQSIITSGQNSIDISAADLEAATAWKMGYFKFNDEPIESIMKKLSRWYDVDIVYRDRINSDEVFAGRMSKYENISKVLEVLELTGGVHFKIEERRIIVMK